MLLETRQTGSELALAGTSGDAPWMPGLSGLLTEDAHIMKHMHTLGARTALSARLPG
jgi:hypothetical protein